MNWLARLKVDAEAVRKEGIWDSYAWHKKMWECYPNAPDEKRDFLTRIDPLEGTFQLWVMGDRKPICPQWCNPEDFDLKQIAPSFLSHQYYAFDLKVNPVKTIVQRNSNGEYLYKPNGKRRSGKRIPLIKHDELHAWIVRKGEVRCRNKDSGANITGGFRIADEKPLEISPMVENHFRKKKQSGYHGGVRFRGVLEVTNRNAFTETYKIGVGSAKAFGFGLLLLSPIIQ